MKLDYQKGLHQDYTLLYIESYKNRGNIYVESYKNGVNKPK